jgi:transcriptional regulator with XRE-family HTH domain
VKDKQSGVRSASFVSIPQLVVLRKRAGLSQRDLAELVGVSMNTISRLERGGKARYNTLLLLAQALHIPTTRLCRRAGRRVITRHKDT